MPTTTSPPSRSPPAPALTPPATESPRPVRPISSTAAANRRFVARPKRDPITEERRELVRRLLLERLSLRAIARAAGVSRTWLQGFVNDLYREQTPWEPGPLKKSRAG